MLGNMPAIHLAGCHVAPLPRSGGKENPLIRWHSTTCKTCAHYLWNSSAGDLAGYGCAMLAHLPSPNSADAACPNFLEHQYTARWYSRISIRHRLERQPDYAADGRWSKPAIALEPAEWAEALCQRCGEYRHECRCETEDDLEA
jgi:hypothetical protein